MTILRLAGPDPNEPPALIANGLVGLRLPQRAGHGECHVAGLFGRRNGVEGAAMVPAPFPLGWTLGVGGAWTSHRGEALRVVAQELDTATGEFVSRWAGGLGGQAVEVATQTWCSRLLPAAVAQEVAVTLPAGGTLVIQAVIAAHGLSGRWERRSMPDVDGWDHQLLYRAADGEAGSLGMALSVELSGGRLLRRWRVDRTAAAEQSMTCLEIELPAGGTARMRQIATLVPSRLHPEPEWQAARLLGAARDRGFDGLRAEDRAIWAGLLRTRPRLHGAPAATRELLASAHHQVHAHLHHAIPIGLAGYGLGGAQLYGGHTFPSDALMLTRPWIDLADPGAARAMCENLAMQLPQARCNAALRGQSGGFFAWQADPAGAEMNGAYSVATQHLSQQPMAALACLHHAQATGDALWRREVAWPVLQAVARWGEHAWRDGHLRRVSGFNEHVRAIDDPVLAALGMRRVYAAAIAEAAAQGLAPPQRWRELAEGIAVAHDASGAVMEHAAWRPPEGRFEPHALLPFFPLHARPSAAAEAATYARDLALMRPGIAGDEWCVWPWLAGTWAARAGDRALASACIDGTADAFAWGAFRAVREIHRDHEPAPWKAGNPPWFVTGGGALLTSIGIGMTGLEPGDGPPASWAVHAPALPAGWEAIEIDQLWLHGRPWRLRAAPGMERAELLPL